MPKSASKEQEPITLGCPDCALRDDAKQPRFMRVRHTDRGLLLPTGRPLDERCEMCGGSGRVFHERAW